MNTTISYKTIDGLTVSKEITAEEIAKHVINTEYFDLTDVLFHPNDIVEDYLDLNPEVKNGELYKPDLDIKGDNLYDFCQEIEVRLDAEKYNL